MRGDVGAESWFLRADQRGNSATSIDRRRGDGLAWTTGNQVRFLVHGGPYFEALHRALCETEPGDRVSFTDWRGDPDERLVDGQTLADVLIDLARRGVEVRGLVWRSHSKLAGFHLEHHVELARQVNEAGGRVVLDQRVRPAGSHHQKLVLIRHRNDVSRDLAFVGGIDLCHGRRDDDAHGGDPQPEDLDDSYGERPPWHDIQVMVRGPAVGDLDHTFRERWNDTTPPEGRRGPIRAALSRAADQPASRDMLPDAVADPPPAGNVAVQVLRTYPAMRRGYPFAPEGERSIVRAYRKALERARSLIYVEDQYLWSSDVASLFAEAMERAPTLKLIVVVPRIPDRNGPLSGPPHRLAQLELVERLDTFGRDRFGIFDLENEQGTPIYVHAKTVIVDDTWAAVGSDNLNRRSWTHDSELSCAILDGDRDPREPTDPGGLGDGARVFARALRLSLMREHLGLGDGGELVEPGAAFDKARRSADALDRWHAGGRRGPRPVGRLRNHRLPDVHRWERPWAWPVYRTLVDPDGRPRAMRRRDEF
jgi:phosphatidylserine/phosphatidylglycerophosphate/cardiolipin synthase-like enzyme